MLLLFAAVLAVVLSACGTVCRRRQFMHPGAAFRHSSQHLGRYGMPSFLSAQDVQRLRLMMLDRDFGSQDYEMLLGLDEHTPSAVLQAATPEEIRRFPVFRFSRCASFSEMIL